jgi:hypothetical protein
MYMVHNRRVGAELKAGGCPHDLAAPRLGVSPGALGLLSGILFAAILLMLTVADPAAGASFSRDRNLDVDGNGLEDALDLWRRGELDWPALRARAGHGRLPEGLLPHDPASLANKTLPAGGDWSAGALRLICLGADRGAVLEAVDSAAKAGQGRLLHDLAHFGGVQVVSLDEAALRAFLKKSLSGRIMLDREGLPALAESRYQVGADQAAVGQFKLGNDWSSTVAILDSGCDTAHGDLGDFAGDNADGPPPAVGDADDWYSAVGGWPLFEDYRIVGWHDVSDDFPQAQGPWDYYFHGTGLASVVAGSGSVDPTLRGLNPGGRLTVVKFYDFDDVWHAWLGDYLAACAWTLDNRQTYRVRTVLSAVNWEADLGLSEAMDAFLDAGIVPVVAMGNFGDDPAGPGYPASLPQVLTVGSVDPDGAVSVFSGHGLADQIKPDLLAPGGGVMVADNEPDDTYSLRQGTSLSAAHVAGALYMLEEALVDNGIRLPADRQSALIRMALLKGSCARVEEMAGSGGGGPVPLDAHDQPDNVRGWGSLRIDAAINAALVPLFPGADQLDTLGQDFTRPVSGRRLALNPGIRYLVEAVPTAGLDVALAVVFPGEMGDEAGFDSVLRANANEAGISEFLYIHGPGEGWAYLNVQALAGTGEVTLRLREADTFTTASSRVQLPGNMTGGANFGALNGAGNPCVVVPTRVTVGHLAPLHQRAGFRWRIAGRLAGFLLSPGFRPGRHHPARGLGSGRTDR